MIFGRLRVTEETQSRSFTTNSSAASTVGVAASVEGFLRFSGRVENA